MEDSAQTQRRRATNWYVWLWVSPIFTIPSLMFLLVSGVVPIAVLGSALWHLILLYPALKDESDFVRWHGRQALLLAGVRTAVPLYCGLSWGTDGIWLAIFALVPIYFVGNIWSQRQATRGHCSLMRRFGLAQELLDAPLAPAKAKPVAAQRAVESEEAKGVNPDALVDIIRFSRDPEERREALSQLEKLGMVESLGHAPPAPPAAPRPAPSARAISTPSVRTVPRISVRPPASVRTLPQRRPFLFYLGVFAAILVIGLLGYWAPLAAPSKPTAPPPPTATSQRPSASEARSLAVDYRTLGLARHAQGEYEEAIADYTQAIRLDPSYALAYQSRGNAYRALGEYEAAIADYEEVIGLNPKYAPAYNNLAWTMAYHLDTDYEEALDYALRAVELDPDEHHHDTLALVYYKLERYDEALEHYSLALSLESDFAASYRGRGDVYLALGDYQAALDDYERYLELEPDASDRQTIEETIDWLQGQGE
jgi:tetratricopeptide (TPR) repeat protein